MKSVAVLFYFLGITLILNAQRQTDNWYFGERAGISFRTGNPIPLYDGAFENWEGSAVISDSLGNLLFYTNGVTVWNAAHDTMQNGDGLKGSYSSTQSALIVPKPLSSNLYYIFTTDDIEHINNVVYHDGLKYSIVDMNQDNGLGAIVEKNKGLRDSVSEKVTAVRHANGRDVWVITHEWNTDKFYTWLITAEGIKPPVISAVGTAHNHVEEYFFINNIGYMKASPDGSKLALILKRAMLGEIFDFNTATGVISNPITLELEHSPYGVEFSPDLSKLYVSDNNELYQYNLQAGTLEDIQNSAIKLYTANHYIGAIQTAQDGKLYVAMHEQGWVGVISQPDSLGEFCNFEPEGVFLDGRICLLGLPNFIQTWFNSQPIRVEPGCVGEATNFFMRNTPNSDSVQWSFDDPESGPLNISSQIQPSHVYSAPGAYHVELTNWFGGVSELFSYLFYIEGVPQTNIGNDTILCGATSYLIDAYNPHYSYIWQDNSTDSVFIATETGKYYVNVRDIYTGCSVTDTLLVKFAQIPEINLGNDTSFCENSTFRLVSPLENCTFRWQDNSADSVFIAQDIGSYFLEVKTQDNCTNTDTIHLTHKYLPRFNLGFDTIICENDTYTKHIEFELSDVEITWVHSAHQDTTFDFDYVFFEPDNVIVTTKNQCGEITDTLAVGTKYCGEIQIPNVFTPDGSGQNESFYIEGIESLTCSLFVYNRWGNLVYESQHYTNNWTAINCSSGVYYYVLSCSEKNMSYTGFVHVFK